MELSLAHVVAVTGAHATSAPAGHVTSVHIDSRAIEPGSLFVALRGEHRDGHNYVTDAFRRGAAAALVRSDWAQPVLDGSHKLLLRVDAPLAALQKLARDHLDRLPSLIRVAVTGSNGKTTTKDLLGSVLRLAAPTLVTPGNRNSEIGLPLSVLSITGAHTYAVLELGINHPGEMDVLADIVRPDIAVFTSISGAHTQLLGDLGQVAREKGRLLVPMAAAATAFVREGENQEEELLRAAVCQVRRFGPTTTLGYAGSVNRGLDGFAINWEGLQIRFPLFGNHNLTNALAAITVCRHLGIHREEIKRGLENARATAGRSEVIRGPVTVVKDCYNANPDSVTQLLEFTASLRWSGRRVAVLGPMLEIAETEAAHAQVGRQAATAGLDAVFFFGDGTQPGYQSLLQAGFSGAVLWTADFAELSQAVERYTRPGDLLLIKGSRATQLERLVPAA